MGQKAEVDLVSERPSAEEISELFQRHYETKRRSDRAKLVEAHMGFAHHVAKRFFSRGVADEDLRQVAFLGLVKAIDRYDPTRGIAFTTFGGRTIEGEIKRHFRDQSWAAHVPRSAKELHLKILRVRDDLSHELGRSPVVSEIAERLDVTVDEVVEATAAGAAYSSSPLEPGSQTDRAASLATQDPDLARSEDALAVEALMAELPDRQREIVQLSFFDGLSQQQIADRVGLSQMHVSRLLRQAFDTMRESAGSIHEI